MKINRIFLIAIVAIVGLNTVLVQTASANQNAELVVSTTQSLTPSFVEGEVLVKVLENSAYSKADQAVSLSQRHDLDARVSLELPHEGSLWIHLATRDGRSTNDLLRELGDNQSVILVEVVYPRKKALVPNDPMYQYQRSNLDQDNAVPLYFEETQKLSAGPEVIVAHLDTGIDFRNLDLVNRVRPELGYDFINSDSDASDDDGHGTGTAGQIAAETNNGYAVVGFAGLANVDLVPVKVLGNGDSGTSAAVVAGLNHVSNLIEGHPNLRVVNLSLGGRGKSLAERDALIRLYLQGVLVVASAGNLGENTDVSPHFPSGWAQYLPNVISVGGIDGFGQVAEMSNFGAMSVTCFASWGATMLSLDGSIAGGAGTSIACASISGVAAVLAAKNPGMTAWQLREQITRTAARKGFLEGKCQTGAMLDALAAVSTQPTLDSIDVLETKGKVKYASATSIVTIKIASTDPGAVITVLGYEAVIKIKPSFQKIKLTNVKIRPAGSDLWFTVISSKGGVLYIMGDGSSSQRWPAT